MRLQALLLVKNGLSLAKVADDISVHRSTVRKKIFRVAGEQDPKFT
jgi:transposase